MRIVCQQTILMKYHALFFIFEKVEKIKFSSAANYRWRLRELNMLRLRYYGILFAQLLQFYADLFETWQMLLSWHVDVHMVFYI